MLGEEQPSYLYYVLPNELNEAYSGCLFGRPLRDIPDLIVTPVTTTQPEINAPETTVTPVTTPQPEINAPASLPKKIVTKVTPILSEIQQEIKRPVMEGLQTVVNEVRPLEDLSFKSLLETMSSS